MSTLTESANTNEATNNNNSENEHLLQHEWVLWFRPPASQNTGASQSKAWENSQRHLFAADTVEGFWKGFHKVPRIAPGHVVNCDYSLFKEGIKPMWEDDFNEHGGRWTYNIERRQNHGVNTSITSVIEQSWLDVMLCLIGEGFGEHGDKVAGGVCGLRHNKGPKTAGGHEMNAKIHIWTKDARDVDTNMEIGKILKEVLHAADGQLSYTPHETGGRGGRGNYNTKLNL